jgi:hypothetical protein
MFSESYFTKKALVAVMCFFSGASVYADGYTQDYEDTVEPLKQQPYLDQYTVDYEETVFPQEEEYPEEGYYETVAIEPDTQPVFISSQPTVIHHEPVVIYEQVAPRPVFIASQPTVIHHEPTVIYQQPAAQHVFIAPQPTVIHHKPQPSVIYHQAPVAATQNSPAYVNNARESVSRLAKTFLSGFCASAFAMAHNCTFKHVVNCFADTYGKFGLLGELGIQLFCNRYPRGILHSAFLSTVSFGAVKAFYEYCKVNNIHMQRLMRQSAYVFAARCIIEAMFSAVAETPKNDPTAHVA